MLLFVTVPPDVAYRALTTSSVKPDHTTSWKVLPKPPASWPMIVILKLLSSHLLSQRRLYLFRTFQLSWLWRIFSAAVESALACLVLADTTAKFPSAGKQGRHLKISLKWPMHAAKRWDNACRSIETPLSKPQ